MEENKKDSSFEEEKEQLNNPSTDETIVPAAEKSDLPTGQAGIINPTTDIKDMEVHHHAHDPVSPHLKKNWKSYFWEFLMLFLAVFCGFLAENQREHIIEHQRANVYAANLYEELKMDTASLNSIIESNKSVIGKLDSFCLFSTEKEKRSITNGMLYYYSEYTTSVEFFASNNTTIEQLKGSGNLRTMPNHIAQKISSYSKKLSTLENEYRISRAEFEKIEDLYFKIFDGYTTQLLTDAAGGNIVNRDSVFKLNLPLINDDPKLMKEFTGWLKFESSIYSSQNSNFHIPLKQTATELIGLLKKEYHLK